MSAPPKRGQRQRCSGGALKSLKLRSCSHQGSQSSIDLLACEFRIVPARKSQRTLWLKPQLIIYRGSALRGSTSISQALSERPEIPKTLRIHCSCCAVSQYTANAKRAENNTNTCSSRSEMALQGPRRERRDTVAR